MCNLCFLFFAAGTGMSAAATGTAAAFNRLAAFLCLDGAFYKSINKETCVTCYKYRTNNCSNHIFPPDTVFIQLMPALVNSYN